MNISQWQQGGPYGSAEPVHPQQRPYDRPPGDIPHTTYHPDFPLEAGAGATNAGGHFLHGKGRDVKRPLDQRNCGPGMPPAGMSNGGPQVPLPQPPQQAWPAQLYYESYDQYKKRHQDRPTWQQEQLVQGCTAFFPQNGPCGNAQPLGSKQQACHSKLQHPQQAIPAPLYLQPPRPGYGAHASPYSGHHQGPVPPSFPPHACGPYSVDDGPCSHQNSRPAGSSKGSLLKDLEPGSPPRGPWGVPPHLRGRQVAGSSDCSRTCSSVPASPRSRFSNHISSSSGSLNGYMEDPSRTRQHLHQEQPPGLQQQWQQQHPQEEQPRQPPERCGSYSQPLPQQHQEPEWPQSRQQQQQEGQWQEPWAVAGSQPQHLQHPQQQRQHGRAQDQLQSQQQEHQGGGREHHPPAGAPEGWVPGEPRREQGRARPGMGQEGGAGLEPRPAAAASGPGRGPRQQQQPPASSGLRMPRSSSSGAGWPEGGTRSATASIELNPAGHVRRATMSTGITAHNAAMAAAGARVVMPAAAGAGPRKRSSGPSGAAAAAVAAAKAALVRTVVSRGGGKSSVTSIGASSSNQAPQPGLPPEAAAAAATAAAAAIKGLPALQKLEEASGSSGRAASADGAGEARASGSRDVGGRQGAAREGSGSGEDGGQQLVEVVEALLQEKAKLRQAMSEKDSEVLQLAARVELLEMQLMSYQEEPAGHEGHSLEEGDRQQWDNLGDGDSNNGEEFMEQMESMGLARE